MKADVGRIRIDVISGVEGPSLYLNDRRIAGPKPWGGGAAIHSWTVDLADFEKQMKLVRDRAIDPSFWTNPADDGGLGK